MSTPDLVSAPQCKLGNVSMKQPDDDEKILMTGFEFGCPGRDPHIGLRFYEQPGTALDGQPFPAATTEAATAIMWHMVQRGLPLELTGLANVPGSLLYSPASEAEAWKRTMNIVDAMASSPVTAKWFVMHDTGGSINVKEPPKAARGAHLFVGHVPDDGDSSVAKRFRGVYLCNDFSTFRQATTKFEWTKHHPEFRGLMIHVELLNVNTKVSANPADVYTDFQYECAVWSYICASLRAGEWLTVTAHIEVDRGISNGHSDPRGFDFEYMYQLVCGYAGLPGSGTFGILNARIGDNVNRLDYLNTFPAQYGGVLREGKLKK